MVAWLDAASGEVGRVEQFGTATDDEAYGLAVASDGGVWASGSTGGAISEGVETQRYGHLPRPLRTRSRNLGLERRSEAGYRGTDSGYAAGGKGPALARSPGVGCSSRSSTHGTLAMSASSDTPVS